ncbi:thiamine biosynthesis lipoprotein [Agromyces flavus]|uniref:FAD:protein FMN transferase n=1 Tax=Agromyces flavus TaxID=589382 RepID=A0A1H1LUZ4_9MICO|nr:FAD:protein FMN transferase [Agromyces flavus]MCP2368644.1 thiamine biosynthesis lipoprotein [Agromyces flavus]GGI48116.1 FAD:protein FMN transferase [Agromyces flavus]SDR78444.1 thiamine biosynthesis lipoprotein [Agromyces flavus]
MDGAALPRGAFAAMGTVVSVRLDVDGVHADTAVAAVAAIFARWEVRCSLFDPASELSRVGRGELALTDASADVRDAYALALRWRDATDGVFTPHRGDGVIDLNGVVKALAVEEAGVALDRAGFAQWAVDAGGDVLVAADATSGTPSPWAIGIVDPSDRTALLARFDLDGARRRAIATSGSAERGDHIWTRAGEGPSPFVQVSVVAADLVTADVLATAIVAGGRASLDELVERFDVDVLAIARGGELLATPGWPRAQPASVAGAASPGGSGSRAIRPMAS